MSDFVTGKIPRRLDPKAFSDELESRYKRNGWYRVLGLDLGTNCGFAVAFVGKDGLAATQPVMAGMWDLSIGNYDSGALRHVRLRAFLAAVSPHFIGYEEPKVVLPEGQFAGKPIAAILARAVPTAEFLGSLKTTVMCWSEDHGVAAKGYGISEIKKFLSGKGNAGKPEMIKACNERYGTDLSAENFESTGHDNVADAIGVCALSLEAYTGGLA